MDLDDKKLFDTATHLHLNRERDGLSDGKTALYLRRAVKLNPERYDQFPTKQLLGCEARYHLAFAKTHKKQDTKINERLGKLVKLYGKDKVLIELEKDSLINDKQREQIKNVLFPKPIANEKTSLLPKNRM